MKQKKKLNMLDDEINNVLEKLEENLTNLKLRCIFCGKMGVGSKNVSSKLRMKH